MKNFSDDFLRQTNLLIGEPTPFDNAGGPPLSAMIAGLDSITSQLNDLTPHQGEEKKERKKRQHDPNAPKRPLTPYFLYMQTARPIIANDLGADAPKGAVQEEGQRRWAAMTPTEKTVSTSRLRSGPRPSALCSDHPLTPRRRGTTRTSST